jgi:hypothetical protein
VLRDFQAPFHPGDIEGFNVPRGPLTVPILSINSTFFTNWDQVSPYTESIVRESARNSGRAVSIEIQGSIHLSQSDIPILFDRALMKLPTSAAKLDAGRCLELNIKATLEFMRIVLPVQHMPVPDPERAGVDKQELSKLGIRRSLRKEYLGNRNERVLEGDVKEVAVLFKQL